MRHYFQVELQEEIVLNSHGTNQGLPKTLDYIPGTVFLGIVAKDLQEFPFELLTSKVKFSDAHLSLDGEYSLRLPQSFFYNKTDKYKDNGYLQLNSIYSPLSNKKFDGQPKQIREGFFAPKTSEYQQLEKNISLKSAYESDKRKSKDEEMYTYEGITPKHSFIFFVDIDEKLEELNIPSKLQGKKFIGKSKSNQYGKVSIKELPDYSFSVEEGKYTNLYLYFLSNVALLDEETLEPTTVVSPKHFGGTDNDTLLWEKSSLSFHTYAPFVGVRQSRDRERVVIKKGSVVAIQTTNPERVKEFCKNGIGAFQNEGFGQLLINPYFLNPENLKKVESKERRENSTTHYLQINEKESALSSWFKNKKGVVDIASKTDKRAGEFIIQNKMKYPSNLSSQWGAIRQIARKEKDIIKEVEDYITNGSVSKVKWEDVREKFLKELRAVEKDNLDLKKWLLIVSSKMRRGEK